MTIGQAADKVRLKIEAATVFRSADSSARRILENWPEVRLDLGLTESEWNLVRYALDVIGEHKK